jgi:acetoin utilization protein AcuB
MIKTEILIEDMMTSQPLTIDKGETVARAVQLMSGCGIHHLPVMDGERVIGILSQREAALAETLESLNLCVLDVCSQKPYCVHPKTPLRLVALEMAEKHYGSALVVENGKILGIFTTVDACRALANRLLL